MKILYTYAGIKLFKGIFFACCLLSALSLISALIKKVGGRGTELGLMDLISYGLHLLPYMVYEMLPLGCIIGTVLVLRSLAANGELVMMRCLGLSGWRLAALIAIPAFLWGIAAIFWVDYVAIPIYKSSVGTIYRNNVWIEGDQELFYMRSLQLSPTGQSQAEQLVRFIFEDQRLAAVTKAQRLICTRTVCRSQGLSHWLGTTEAAIRISPRTLANHAMAPRSQRLGQLWQAVQQDKGHGLRAWQLWQRLMNPLFFASLSLLMCLFVLYSSPRTSIIRPIVIAIGLGLLADTVLSMIAFSAMLTRLPLWIGSLFPILAVMLITVAILLKKA